MVGTELPQKKILLRRHFSQFLDVVVPVTVFGGICYGSYVFVQQIVIQCLNRELGKPIGTLVCLLFFYFLIVSCLLANWIMIFVNGAGVVTEKINAYKLVTYYRRDEQGVKVPIIDDETDLSTAPEYFFCNSSGYPFYCAQCQSIKPLRARHSSSLKKCVYKMDHYCGYIGSVIGKDNYKNFLNFSINFFVYFVYLFISCLVCIPQQVHHRKQINSSTKINANLVIALILSFCWIFFTGSLIFQHIFYIYWNTTSIERIQNNKKNIKKHKEPLYVNKLYNGKRYIVELNLPIYPYTKSTFKENLYEMYGNNIFTWMLPCKVASSIRLNRDDEKQAQFSFHEERFSISFLQYLHQKIQNNEAILFNTDILI